MRLGARVMKSPSQKYLNRRMVKFRAAVESGELGSEKTTDFQAVLTHEPTCPVYCGGVSLFGGQGNVWPMADSAECPCDFALSLQFTTARP